MAAVERTDPILGFRFGLEIEGIVVGWFTECSNLTLEREVQPQPEGGVNYFIHQLPGPVKATNITLKKGLGGNELWAWLQEGEYDGQVKRRNVSLILFKPDKTEARRWDFKDIYPVKWTGSGFKSSDSGLVLETLELVQDMAADSTGGPAIVQRSESEAGQARPGSEQPDLADLAKKVYALLKYELWVERERLGRGSSW